MAEYYEYYDFEKLKNCIDSKALTIKNMTELLQRIQAQMDLMVKASEQIKRGSKNLELSRLYWRDRFEDLRKKADLSGVDVNKIDVEFSDNYNKLTAHDLTPGELINYWANQEG